MEQRAKRRRLGRSVIVRVRRSLEMADAPIGKRGKGDHKKELISENMK